MTKDHETDTDDLVERLEDSKGWPNLGKAAAARIRALEAEKKELALDVLAAQGQAADLAAGNARLDAEAQAQAQEVDLTRRRADKWQSMVLDCEEHLKDGETPAQRIERERTDNLTLLKLLEKGKRKSEQLEAENARLKNALIATRNDLHEINAGDLSTFEVQDAISAALEEKNDE